MEKHVKVRFCSNVNFTERLTGTFRHIYTVVTSLSVDIEDQTARAVHGNVATGRARQEFVAVSRKPVEFRRLCTRPVVPLTAALFKRERRCRMQLKHISFVGAVQQMKKEVVKIKLGAIIVVPVKCTNLYRQRCYCRRFCSLHPKMCRSFLAYSSVWTKSRLRCNTASEGVKRRSYREFSTCSILNSGSLLPFELHPNLQTYDWSTPGQLGGRASMARIIYLYVGLFDQPRWATVTVKRTLKELVASTWLLPVRSEVSPWGREG